jgi:dipeptidyl aminopeptidase/acylaminoacyl peptidase
VASVGVDGSKYRTIYDGAPIADLAWTRDGKGILLGALTTKDISSVIYVPADGGQPRLTGLEVTRLQGLNPAPEGRRVAFSGVSYRISNDQILPADLANSINNGTQQLLQFTILDRDGHVLRTVGDPIVRSGFISMSPDGTRVGFNCQGGFCVLDLATGAKIQIGGTSARAPAWSFDGGRIIYLSNPSEGGTDVFVRASNGTGQEELLYRNPTDKLAIFHWSQDGRFVMMASQGGGGFWVLPVTGDRKLMSVLTTQFSKNGLRISPDSRFIAYLSNESGANQVWVQPFAPSSSEGPIPTDVRWQVSFQGSLGMIRWRADGKEMYYLAPDGGVMAVPISYDPQFKAGTPAPLFHVPPSFPMSGTPGTIADVSADGQQFVLLLPLSK